MLEKTTRINLLYDFYQHLLTEKQATYMELYYQDDYSLSEIAEQFQVSRQAVFEQIKRAEQLLEEYEAQLHLLAKHRQRQQLFSSIFQLVEGEEEQGLDKEHLKGLLTALKNVD